MDTTFSPSSRSSASPRKLMRWNEDHDQQLLLALEQVIKDNGFKVPWDEVAQLLPDPCTGGACEQHIAKIRKRRTEAGLDIPATPSSRGGSQKVTPRKSSDKRRKVSISSTPELESPTPSFASLSQRGGSANKAIRGLVDPFTTDATGPVNGRYPTPPNSFGAMSASNSAYTIHSAAGQMQMRPPAFQLASNRDQSMSDRNMEHMSIAATFEPFYQALQDYAVGRGNINLQFFHNVKYDPSCNVLSYQGLARALQEEGHEAKPAVLTFQDALRESIAFVRTEPALAGAAIGVGFIIMIGVGGAPLRMIRFASADAEVAESEISVVVAGGIIMKKPADNLPSGASTHGWQESWYAVFVPVGQFYAYSPLMQSTST